MPPTDSSIHQHQGLGMAGGTISLATLIEFILQRTYHELIVLSEILPRKTDMERKIEIVQYASRTRQLFIRLLALVKWANSASKVDKCAEICNFLEQQSMWFVETADTLARMSRETLVNARLPNFSLPCAIDVLTLGTYPRLPTCIRERIVPPDPITPNEKKQTLQRLTQVIQYRLVSSELPTQMRKLKIENGRVKFLVENEFQVTLTLMEDNPVIPWRLLDIDILVEDHETGDGKSLVHSLQVGYIHRLVQSRLLDNDKPLHDLYRVLHSFCQSLQLEVLYSQTQKLVRDRLGDSLRIEEYSHGKCLAVSYWRDQMKKEKPQDAIVYKLTVHVNDEDDGKELCVSHMPSMLPDECRRVGLTIHSEHLSMEKLLMQTIEVRTRSKLKDLSYGIQRYIEGKCEIRDMPLALHLPAVYPCMSSEQLRITVDAQRGMFLASLPSLELQVLQDLQDSLNGDRKDLVKHIVSLRLQLTILRCEASVNCLHSVARRQLPIINQAYHAIDKLPKHRLYVPVPKQPNYHIVVCADDCPPRSVEMHYHLLETTPCPPEGMDVDGSDDVIKPYVKAGRLLPLDTLSITNGPYTSIFKDQDETEIESFHKKRKLLLGEYFEPSSKRSKTSPYFNPIIVHVVAAAEERLPFVFLGEELKEQNVLTTSIQTDREAMSLVMDIVHFPDAKGCSKVVCDALRKRLLSCKVRVITRPIRCWQVEFLFTKGPLKSTNVKETGPTYRVICSYELSSDGQQKVVKDLVDEWTSMCHLFSIVDEFSNLHNEPNTGIQNIVEISSYTYRKLVLSYGPSRTSMITVTWKCDQNQFVLALGTQGSSLTINPHVVMATHLQDDLNETRSLAYLTQILHDTWSPMTSLYKLSTAVILGAGTSPKQSNQSFTIIPQTSTHIRIAFRNFYCLDVHFRNNKVVAVRDGAYSLFDTSKVIEGFTPIPMLKAFLGMFVDDNVSGSNVRNRSTTEDDNPPSPVSMDNMDVFNIPQSLQSSGSPGSRSREIAQSPSTFIGTPSPGNILAAGSPGNPQLHVPSPGSFVPAPSPSSMGIHMQSPAGSFISPQGMSESGSPYPNTSLAMPSPGPRNWPNSPSVQGPSPVSRHGMAASPGHPTLHSPQTQAKDEHGKSTVMSPPSRMLPQRAWAASTPTLLSHEAFDNLLKQTPIQQLPLHVPLSSLERFLGCKFLRRHISRVVMQEKHIASAQAPDPFTNIFKVDSLQYKISLNSSTLQTLHMKIQPLPEYKDQWSQEEIQIFERYFDYKVKMNQVLGGPNFCKMMLRPIGKVGCPPYKTNAITAFSRLLKAGVRVLKDCVQIMRLELMPNQDRTLKWAVQLLMTIPPTYAHIAPAGTPAIVVMAKMVLMLQLTRIGLQLPQQSEPQSITIPLLYNIQDNSITLVEKGPTLPNPNLQQISQMLKRFMERYHQSPECAIYPAVRELMTNLVLPVG